VQVFSKGEHFRSSKIESFDLLGSNKIEKIFHVSKVLFVQMHVFFKVLNGLSNKF
jgi:hypothetical protein